MADGPQPHVLVQDVNVRIDSIIRANLLWERLLQGILVVSFLAGLAVLGFGFWNGNVYLIGGGTGSSGLICWSTLKLRQLYQRKIALSVVPQIVVLLGPRDAAREIHALIKLLLE